MGQVSEAEDPRPDLEEEAARVSAVCEAVVLGYLPVAGLHRDLDVKLAVLPLHQLETRVLVSELVDHLDELVEVNDEPGEEADAGHAEEYVVIL